MKRFPLPRSLFPLPVFVLICVHAWLFSSPAFAALRFHSINPGATQGETITANGDLHQFRINLTKASPPKSIVVHGTTYWKVNEDPNHYYSSTVQNGCCRAA
jgi:hypothetical protein